MRPGRRQPWRIGVDTGGTFTDIAALHPDGRTLVAKVASTPTDPSEAVETGLRQLGPERGFILVHGTTVATNALLQRRGARTALITTEGCRDVLEIARQTRSNLYSLSPQPSAVPLIPRDLRFEVPERLDWQGQLVTPLDLAALERTLDAVCDSGAESLAVCCLFSFLDPSHEVEIGRRARARGLRVSLSHEIAPEFREYERTSTVCANAFVAPVMAAYLERLVGRVAALGCAHTSVMQSNGGTLRASEASASAVKTALSGPAGGLVAALRASKSAELARIITFDMGGTSTDVSLVDGRSTTVRTGEVSGLPLLTPMLDIHTVGAGGGSIARIDTAGGLRVGPDSAGADPGPVAYGRGDRLTVTDANVLLGRLPATTLLAGSVRLDVDTVSERFGVLAGQLGTSSERAAEGVIEAANARMARALRHISMERGHHPADYALVTFGGAGGLHACALAEGLGICRILLPPRPGVFSALGLALAPVRRELVRSYFAPANPSSDAGVAAAIADLARQARQELVAEGVPGGAMALEPYLEARYVGQSYALRIAYRRSVERAASAFHRAHKKRYGHCDLSEPVEIVAMGVSAAGNETGEEGRIHGTALQARQPADVTGQVKVRFAGQWLAAPVFRRSDLQAGASGSGPAIVMQDDATTWIEPVWRWEVDAHGNLILNR